MSSRNIKVKVVETPSKGKVLVAECDLNPGDIVIIEPPILSLDDIPNDLRIPAVDLYCHLNYMDSRLVYFPLMYYRAPREIQLKIQTMFCPPAELVKLGHMAHFFEKPKPKFLFIGKVKHNSPRPDTSMFEDVLMMMPWYVQADPHLFRKLILILDTNSVQTESMGLGLYDLCSRFPHSCAPNCKWSSGTHVPTSQKGIRTVVASTHIRAGEELSISYLSDVEVLRSTNYRQKRLLTSKYFVCTCKHCLTPENRRAFACPFPPSTTPLLQAPITAPSLTAASGTLSQASSLPASFSLSSSYASATQPPPDPTVCSGTVLVYSLPSAILPFSTPAYSTLSNSSLASIPSLSAFTASLVASMTGATVYSTTVSPLQFSTASSDSTPQPAIPPAGPHSSPYASQQPIGNQSPGQQPTIGNAGKRNRKKKKDSNKSDLQQHAPKSGIQGVFPPPQPLRKSASTPSQPTTVTTVAPLLTSPLSVGSGSNTDTPAQRKKSQRVLQPQPVPPPGSLQRTQSEPPTSNPSAQGQNSSSNDSTTKRAGKNGGRRNGGSSSFHNSSSLLSSSASALSSGPLVSSSMRHMRLVGDEETTDEEEHESQDPPATHTNGEDLDEGVDEEDDEDESEADSEDASVQPVMDEDEFNDPDEDKREERRQRRATDQLLLAAAQKHRREQRRHEKKQQRLQRKLERVHRKQLQSGESASKSDSLAIVSEEELPPIEDDQQPENHEQAGGDTPSGTPAVGDDASQAQPAVGAADEDEDEEEKGDVALSAGTSITSTVSAGSAASKKKKKKKKKKAEASEALPLPATVRDPTGRAAKASQASNHTVTTHGNGDANALLYGNNVLGQNGYPYGSSSNRRKLARGTVARERERRERDRERHEMAHMLRFDKHNANLIAINERSEEFDDSTMPVPLNNSGGTRQRTRNLPLSAFPPGFRLPEVELRCSTCGRLVSKQKAIQMIEAEEHLSSRWLALESPNPNDPARMDSDPNTIGLFVAHSRGLLREPHWILSELDAFTKTMVASVGQPVSPVTDNLTLAITYLQKRIGFIEASFSAPIVKLGFLYEEMGDLLTVQYMRVRKGINVLHTYLVTYSALPIGRHPSLIPVWLEYNYSLPADPDAPPLQPIMIHINAPSPPSSPAIPDVRSLQPPTHGLDDSSETPRTEAEIATESTESSSLITSALAPPISPASATTASVTSWTASASALANFKIFNSIPGASQHLAMLSAAAAAATSNGLSSSATDSDVEVVDLGDSNASSVSSGGATPPSPTVLTDSGSSTDSAETHPSSPKAEVKQQDDVLQDALTATLANPFAFLVTSALSRPFVLPEGYAVPTLPVALESSTKSEMRTLQQMADAMATDLCNWYRRSVETMKCLLPPNHKLYRDIEKKYVAAAAAVRKSHPHLPIPEPGPLRPPAS